MAKDTFYFSHDFSSRNDPKLQELQMVHGMGGIGVFWCLVEMLHEQDGYLMLSQCKSYAFALRVDCDLIKSIVFDFSLFENDETRFWSESALCRIQERKSKSKKATESANARWKNANALRTQSEGNAIKESKGKEIKEKKESKKASPFTAPTVFEVQEFFTDKGYSASEGSKAFDYYTAGNWKDGKGNPVKNWKQKMISVWMKDGDKKNGHVQAEKCPLGNPIDRGKYPNWPADKPFTPSNQVRFAQNWPLRSDNT